jgi:hypothetical protein
MALSRLVYFSRNLLDTSQGELADRVSGILAVSVANNRRVDISGGLIFSREWFAQVLEGDRTAVTETFARIQRDMRHGEPAIIEIKPIEARRFGFWWMAAAGVNADTSELLALLRYRTVRSPPHERRTRLQPDCSRPSPSDASRAVGRRAALAFSLVQPGCRDSARAWI